MVASVMTEHDWELFVQEFEQWLGERGVTFWGGEGWTITDPVQRRKAAEWFVGQARRFDEWTVDNYEILRGQ